MHYIVEFLFQNSLYSITLYSYGSGNGYLEVYDDVKIIPEDVGSIRSEIALKNIPWAGTILADTFKLGSDVSPRILVHGKEYYLVVGGTSFTGKSALETYPNTLINTKPNDGNWLDARKDAYDTLSGEGFSWAASKVAEKVVEGLGNIAGKSATFVMSLSDVSEKASIADQDLILMGLLSLSNRGNSFTCAEEAETTMDILNQLTEIEELKGYLNSTNGYSLFLMHLNIYNSKDPKHTMNIQLGLMGIHKDNQAEVRSYLELYEGHIETIAQIVNYYL